jgi:hypothetical protein
MYGEPVSMSFTGFDGEEIRVSANGDTATVQVNGDQGRIAPEDWYGRYAA